MATIQIEAWKNKDDLSRFIAQGIAQRLQLEGAADNLRDHIQDTIETKAQGMFLWANLMLEILKWKTTESDIRSSLSAAPVGIDDMITEMLKVYSSMLQIVAICKQGPVLEAKLRNTYASLIEVIRDDGLSTGSLRSHYGPTLLISAPDTTKIVFAHASIANYFQEGRKRFSERQTAPPVGVIRAEAEYDILKTCLDVFVNPGETAWFRSSDTIRSYAKELWFNHIREACFQRSKNLNGVGNTDLAAQHDVDRGQLIRLMFDFLNNERIVRQWCRDTPWSFFTEVTYLTIFDCIKSWSERNYEQLPLEAQAWISECVQTPAKVFLPVAKVSMKEGFHGDWYTLESLSVVAQIRALIEKDDTLDTLPENLPLDTIINAAGCVHLEQNAVWHRKLAICLRRSGHLHQAIEHFERALKLDYSLVEARGGLAIAWEEQGYHTKVIELEHINATILNERLENADQQDCNESLLRQELSISYETIADNYRMMKDDAMALKYWRKAVETGAIRKEKIRSYLEALWKSSEETAWEEVIRLLRLLQDRPGVHEQNRLTEYVCRERWPDEEPPSFFFMAATAAKKTDNLERLIEAYQSAINSTVAKSHATALVLKVGLPKLYKVDQRNFAKAELLIEEIVDVASIEHDPKIQDLEYRKEALAQDYCRICIRKALTTISDKENGIRYDQKVSNLLKSGIKPMDMSEKINYREKTHLYLAVLQRLYGSLEDVAITLRPYMETCNKMLDQDPLQKLTGLRYLAVCSLVLGHDDDFTPIANIVYAVSGWLCDNCGKRSTAPQTPAICRHCLDFFCMKCVAAARAGQGTQFCVPAHRLIGLYMDQSDSEESQLVFRGVIMGVDEFVCILRAQWGLGES